MDNKIVNKWLNYIFIILVIVLIVMTIFAMTEPLKYDLNVKTQGENVDKSPYLYSALDKYIYAIKREKVGDINKALPILRRKSNQVYNEYSNYINENFEKLTVVSTLKIEEDLMLVKYSINDKEYNSAIIKLFGDTDRFKIYFDERLEK